MSRIPKFLRLLYNMEQALPKNTKAYMSQESAYESLKNVSGKDFGLNSWAWYDWYLTHHTDELSYSSPFRIVTMMFKAGVYRLTKPLQRR